MNKTLRIEAIVLTLDEEGMIADCLSALSWCSKVHVVDSGSVDNTVTISQKLGAHVCINKFQSFASQRNWALENCNIEGDWVLFIDADEVCTEQFSAELTSCCERASEKVAGFYCCSKLMIGNQWVKRASGFPVWQFRVVRPGRGRFAENGHGQMEGEIDGELRYLKTPYEHHAYYKGWSDWVEKHNKYSSKEAASRNLPVNFESVKLSHSTQRNYFIKSRVSNFAFWPLLRFLHAYVFRLGFLDGSAGFVYSLNMAWYEYLIILKLKELRLKGK